MVALFVLLAHAPKTLGDEFALRPLPSTWHQTLVRCADHFDVLGLSQPARRCRPWWMRSPCSVVNESPQEHWNF